MSKKMAKAGWYPDPQHPGHDRYWDGEAWGNARRRADPREVPKVASAKKVAPAGWYDDPTMVNTRRYWDGQRWTQHRHEKTQQAGVYVQQADEASPAAVGWGVVFAILLPIVGFFIGLALLNKRGNL